MIQDDIEWHYKIFSIRGIEDPLQGFILLCKAMSSAGGQFSHTICASKSPGNLGSALLFLAWPMDSLL